MEQGDYPYSGQTLGNGETVKLVGTYTKKRVSKKQKCPATLLCTVTGECQPYTTAHEKVKN
ncbi:MAG: hypothetical protein GC195_10035 [Nostoc sp. RI_552]|jgi:hypothetical protein|nr:hypothetical protein [Nostoc sp. RI_552]